MAALIGVLSVRNRRSTAAIGRVYKELPNKFYKCADGFYSDHNSNRACAWHGGLSSDQEILLSNGVNMPGNLNVYDVPLSDIQLYLEKFQNREAPYSAESVQRIVDAATSGNFRLEEFDPVLLWRAPDGAVYMLSGHSRLEGFRRLCEMGMQQFCSIPAKIIEVPQAEAEEIALRSNTLSTKERDTERAAFYRRELMTGKPYSAVLEVAKKNEGNNARRIVAYAFLNPSGKTFDAMQALEGGQPDSQETIKNIAHWIGEARQKFPMLTDQHENEIYDWLVSGVYGKQYRRKDDFLQKLAAIINQRTEFGVFAADRPLNLLNTASRSFSETQYEDMVLEKKQAIQDLQRQIKNKIADYRERGAQHGQILELMRNDNALLNRLQLELIELERKRGTVISQSKNEISLFAGTRRNYSAIGGMV